MLAWRKAVVVCPGSNPLRNLSRFITSTSCRRGDRSGGVPYIVNVNPWVLESG